jgi:hypothetical protein
MSNNARAATHGMVLMQQHMFFTFSLTSTQHSCPALPPSLIDVRRVKGDVSRVTCEMQHTCIEEHRVVAHLRDA